MDDGEVHLVRNQVSGQSLSLQRANRNAVVADASLHTHEYHCDAIAHGEARLSSLPVAVFREFFGANSEAAQSWMIHLRRTAQDARFRAEMVSLRTVDKRLDAWGDWHQTSLPEKGKRRDLADELGVTPEALYRSSAKRR